MELFAVKYGESYYDEKYIYHDMASSNGKTKFMWMFYLAKYQEKILLFDTGFRDATLAATYQLERKEINRELQNIVGGPLKADVVFLTHSHFDHIGNLDLFEHSEIIISEKEYRTALEKCSEPVKNRLKSNRVIRVKEQYLFEEKFNFKVIGGHTFGSSVIYFKENGKHYVLTGDECYMCDNLTQLRPIGDFTDLQKNKKFIENTYENRIIPLPFHDGKIFETYKHVSENIAQII
ncbi:MAG TPA: MBL fold metallo-hydrolase [Clostridia bacterium]|nr:MBL fold metallo-hydrolase [Clostridia bacterium]